MKRRSTSAKVSKEDQLRRGCVCPVPGCKNYSDQGTFVGGFCAPCFDYIVHGRGVRSQAYRNELVKANFRAMTRTAVLSEPSAYSFKAYAVYRNPGK